MDDAGNQLFEFLEGYCATLTAYDAEAAAALWDVPGTIVDDRFSGVVESREAMAAGLAQSYPLYRALGLASVGFELLEHRELTDALVQVRVRWLFRDAAGDLLTDSTPHDVLRRTDDGLRACVCVQTDDLATLTELAERAGVDLSDPPT